MGRVSHGVSGGGVRGTPEGLTQCGPVGSGAGVGHAGKSAGLGPFLAAPILLLFVEEADRGSPRRVVGQM